MDACVTHGNRAPGGCWHYDPLSPLEAAMRFSRAEGERKPAPFNLRTTELDSDKLEALLDSGDAPHTRHTPPRHHNTTRPQGRTAPQHHDTTAPRHHDTTTPRHHKATARRSTTQQHHNTTTPPCNHL